MTLERQMTLMEFLAQPETRPYRELLNGRVVEKAMPKRPHSALHARLAQKLLNWVDEGGHGEVLTEQRCILATPAKTHVQLPDVAWFAHTVDLQDGNVIVPPTVAVEILSPDDSYTRVKEKPTATVPGGRPHEPHRRQSATAASDCRAGRRHQTPETDREVLGISLNRYDPVVAGGSLAGGKR